MIWGWKQKKKEGQEKKGKNKLIVGIVFFVIAGILVNAEDVDVVEDAEDVVKAEEVEAEEVQEEAEETDAEREEREKAEAEEVAKKEKADKEKAEKEKAEKEAKEKAEAEKKAQKKIDDYANFIIDHSARFSDMMNRFSEQMYTFNMSDDWIFTTATVLLEMDMLTDEPLEYEDVPEIFGEVNDLYLKAMEQYKTVAKELPIAIDNFDVDEIDRLTGNIEKGNQLIDDATNLIIEIDY